MAMTQVAFGHFAPGLRGGLRVGQVPGDAGRQGGGQTLRTDRVEAEPGGAGRWAGLVGQTWGPRKGSTKGWAQQQPTADGNDGSSW